jgi:hypothetical protein
MNPFPNEIDLIQLFATEPELLEEGVPWAYNTLRFTTARGSDRVTCKLVPGYGELGFTWDRDGDRLLTIHLSEVSGLSCELSHATDALTVLLKGKNLGELRIQLRPRVEVQWGPSRP